MEEAVKRVKQRGFGFDLGIFGPQKIISILSGSAERGVNRAVEERVPAVCSQKGTCACLHD